MGGRILWELSYFKAVLGRKIPSWETGDHCTGLPLQLDLTTPAKVWMVS